jgi:hypothetical protein
LELSLALPGDVMLDAIDGCQGLVHLDVTATSASKSRVQRFAAEHPRCLVLSQHGAIQPTARAGPAPDSK